VELAQGWAVEMIPMDMRQADEIRRRDSTRSAGRADSSTRIASRSCRPARDRIPVLACACTSSPAWERMRNEREEGVWVTWEPRMPCRLEKQKRYRNFRKSKTPNHEETGAFPWFDGRTGKAPDRTTGAAAQNLPSWFGIDRPRVQHPSGQKDISVVVGGVASMERTGRAEWPGHPVFREVD